VNPDGSGLVQITDNSVADIRPVESPDGSQIAFSRFTGTDFDVFTMNADGSGLVNLTNDTDSDSNPAWTPAG
jgi:TolB protein